MRDAFSIRSNIRSLFYRPTSNLPIVDGLRALSILAVVLFHCCLSAGAAGIDDGTFRQTFGRFVSRPIGYVLMQGDLGVDVFFVISGFLVGRMLLSELAESGTINVSRFYSRRALRLLPAYFTVLLLYAWLRMPNVQSIWANIIYVNNYLPLNMECMNWAWSLAIEEHFYALFPLVALMTRPGLRRLQLALVGLLIVSVLARAWAVSQSGIELPINMQSDEAFPLFFDKLYARTHLRYGALVIGVLAACLWERTDFAGFIARRRAVSFGLVVAALGLICSTCSIPRAWVPGMDLPWPALARSHVLQNVFLSCYHYAFATGIAALMLVSLAIPTGPIARFLAMPGWYPIAQLSYSMYLLNNIIVERLLVAFDRTGHTVAGVFVYSGLCVCATFAAAAVVYIAIERPVMRMRRTIGATVSIAPEIATRAT